MKKTFFKIGICLFLLTSHQAIKAHEYAIYPGFRLGYIWSKGGGSINGGVELSVVFFEENNDWYPFGFVLDFDGIPHLNSTKLHLGIEKNISLFGIDVGPTFLFGKENKVGFSVIPYAGLLLIPYIDIAVFKDLKTVGLGTYVKVPVKTNISLFGED